MSAASVLPAARTRVFGRDGAVADVRERLVHGDRRLITLVGTGGIGKTTLAIEVARAAEAAFVDGVRVVDLVSLADDDEVAAACVRALDIADQGHDVRELLATVLAPRSLLLVLDNCEPVRDGVATLVDGLLDACPDLRVLATSRVPLRVRGEVVLPVEPVEIPSAQGAAAALEDVSAVPSVALFIDRATAAAPGFRLTAETLDDVVRICRRLDGMPLAIELAAASTMSLAPAEIAERLDRWDGLRLLERGTAGGRHETLEAALDWSHDLLDPGAQVAFRRLGVFVGGWTVDAAQAVVGHGEGGQTDVVRHLATLVEHSLVRREEVRGRSRYRMLEPVAAYARARLDDSGERDAIRMAHARYLLVATTPTVPFGQNRPEDIARIEAEADDLRAALRAAEAAGALMLAAGLLSNLLVYWRIRGRLSEGLTEIDHLLAHLGPAPTALRAGHLLAQADYLQVSGRFDAALERAAAAEAIATELGDDPLARTAIALRGIVLGQQGELDRARDALEEAARRVAIDGDEASAGFAQAALGAVAIARGDLEAAGSHLERAAAAFDRAPSWFRGRVLGELGLVARRRGDRAAARGFLRDALAWLHDYGATVESIGPLEEAAYLALDDGDGVRAATLLSAATALRDAIAVPPTTEQRSERDRAIREARRVLDARRFRTAWARGQAMSLVDAVALQAESSPDGLRGRTRLPHGPELTPRERDIAALVAQGLTNPQIAERLLLATGTVRIHVERILGKLGMTSRVQIATWFLSEGSESADADDEMGVASRA